MENNGIKCSLCPHNCEIPENFAGFCGVRKNTGGKLYAAGYGKIASIALDPLEKKPLYKFHPGKYVLSVGGFGCNFRCPFCQNFEISTEYEKIWESAKRCSPEHIAALAKRAVPDGNIGVAHTYNEPLVGYEFLRDTAEIIKSAGLLNVIVTNGYINKEPLLKLLPYTDAMNIDLKAFTDGFYKRLGGDIRFVKETIEISRKYCHVEVTTLIIPGENDSEDEIDELSRWIASVDPEIPLHLSRFFPRHKYLEKTPTPRETIYKLSKIAKKYLKNTFNGNMG